MLLILVRSGIGPSHRYLVSIDVVVASISICISFAGRVGILKLDESVGFSGSVGHHYDMRQLPILDEVIGERCAGGVRLQASDEELRLVGGRNSRSH